MKYNTSIIVQSFLKHLTERNLKELIKLFSETVDWNIPGDESKAAWLGKKQPKRNFRCF